MEYYNVENWKEGFKSRLFPTAILQSSVSPFAIDHRRIVYSVRTLLWHFCLLGFFGVLVNIWYNVFCWTILTVYQRCGRKDGADSCLLVTAVPVSAVLLLISVFIGLLSGLLMSPLIWPVKKLLSCSQLRSPLLGISRELRSFHIRNWTKNWKTI